MVDGEVAIRSMMTMSVNFNAKVIDVQEASSFFNDVCQLVAGGLHEHLVDELLEMESPEQEAAVLGS